MGIVVGNYVYPQPEANAKANLTTFEQVAGLQGGGPGILRTFQLGERGGILGNNLLSTFGYPQSAAVKNFAEKAGRTWRMLSIPRTAGAIVEAVEAGEKFRKASVSYPGLPGVSQACSTAQRIDLGVDALLATTDAMAMGLYSAATIASCSKTTAVATVPFLRAADALTLGKDSGELYFCTKEVLKANQAEKVLATQGAPKETVLAYRQTKIHSALKAIKAVCSIVSGTVGFAILLGIIEVSSLALSIIAFAVTAFAITAMIYREKMKYKPVNVLTDIYDTSRPALPAKPKIAVAAA